MKKTVILTISVVILLIIGQRFLTKRNFFTATPSENVFGNEYFVHISSHPEFWCLSFNMYACETHLPGWYFKGHLQCRDSLICGIESDNSPFPFFNFRSDQSVDVGMARVIPSFVFCRRDEKGYCYFKFEPARFSNLPNVDSVVYKLSFKEGIKGFLIHYGNSEVKEYGKYY